MRVILLRDVRAVGQKDEVREVSDGYARNFLIARGLAKIATPQEIQQLEDRRKKRAERNKEIQERLAACAKKISGETLDIHAPAGEKGELFKAVIKETIADELRKKYPDEPLEKVAIHLDKPIKAVGEYKVEIEFVKNIIATVLIKILPKG